MAALTMIDLENEITILDTMARMCLVLTGITLKP